MASCGVKGASHLTNDLLKLEGGSTGTFSFGRNKGLISPSISRSNTQTGQGSENNEFDVLLEAGLDGRTPLEHLHEIAACTHYGYNDPKTPESKQYQSDSCHAESPSWCR